MPSSAMNLRALLDRLPIALVRASVLGALMLGMTACAELPQNVPRPVSHALASAEGTPLGELVQQRRREAGARSPSGFLLLEGPQAAYGSRLALVEATRQTLDLQYYAIHADASTARLMRAVREAAARGVRVRILLDDFHSTGRNALVLRLAFERNIEIRLFNPLAGGRASALGRILNSLGDAGRIQQRMHNKLFIADNSMGIIGGRNLGDAYFGHGDAGNFVDLDVLAAGDVVREMSRSFDAYWNNERAYPVQSLVSREELEGIRSAARDERERQGEAADAPRPPDGEPRPAQGERPAQAAARRAAVWNQQPMDLKTQPFVWAPAAMLVDQPTKIPADDQAARDPVPTAKDETLAGDTVVDGLLQLIGQARSDLLIISPYFVPGPDMKRAFAEAVRRGVRVRILTNSLASNDAPIAHVGYARHRRELLDLGALRDAQRAGHPRQRPGRVRRQRGRRVARHAAQQGAGGGRPAAGGGLDEPGPALAEAEHRDRPAGAQPAAVGPDDGTDRDQPARGCLARGAGRRRRPGVAGPARQRPAGRAQRARCQPGPAAAAEADRAAGAGRAALEPVQRRPAHTCLNTMPLTVVGPPTAFHSLCRPRSMSCTSSGPLWLTMRRGFSRPPRQS